VGVAREVAGRGEGMGVQKQGMVWMGQRDDVAVNAVSNKDKVIASRAVDGLKDLVVRYLPEKARGRPAWFKLSLIVRENPDFVSMAPTILEDIETDRTWIEWKVLRQYQSIFTEALGGARDLAHQVVINTRYIGGTALEVGDDHVIDLFTKFMNTFLRNTLNAPDVRPPYNVLNHYRLFVTLLLIAGRADLAVALAGHLRYYAQIAHGMELGFVTET